MTAGLDVRGIPVSDPAGRHLGTATFHVVPGELLGLGSDSVDVSQLLASVAGRTRLLGGEVDLDDEPITADRSPSRLGYVAADHTLIGTLTSVENVVVSLMAGAAGTGGRTDWQRAQEALTTLGLSEDSWHNLVEQLSGGQQQRVALARALAPSPRVLVLDEPTSELDPVSAARVADALRVAARGGCAVLVGTTDPVVLDACDRRLTL